ncbi:MAG: hypothetical protein R2809_14185 [Flavobacteriales bacterium]
MNSRLLVLDVFLFLSVGCATNTQNNIKYIYYLHGRIIEIQGKDAISEEYGNYEFDSIVTALSDKDHVVIAEIRTENVDYIHYANKVSKEIDSLVATGIQPANITIIGASKGAIIASHISTLNLNSVNYVLLAGNNEYQEQNNDWKFHGQVLCFYDHSDTIAGGNYDYWKNRENYTNKFEQIELKTQLGHGFLYKPLKEWIEPTRKWILNQEI